MTRARGESPRYFCHTRAPYEDLHWSMFAVVSSWDVHFMKLREPHHISQGVAAASVSHRVAGLGGGAGDGKPDVSRCRAPPPTTSRNTAP
jgi:hypothetical protein